ncbi:hypothetical protein FRB96_004439 [Tulasnella sp. 330]|nr:hypothetical protein FRB96_004439 [Tulasnella sp. 330]KAG8876842.1 hypothetical protein FRB97_003842 [Tulasnella sp. 331]
MSSIDDTHNVTITILPVSLSLVHIPRNRLKQWSHSIIRQILRPAPAFLNISCNATEVSIIAECDTIEPFVKAARRDLKTLERSRRSQAEEDDVKEERRQRREVQPVEVSSGWSALQIDSHGDHIDDASTRIREISALLSGISIQYQSSYQADILMASTTIVHSRSLPRVIAILTEARYLRIPRASSSFSRTTSPHTSFSYTRSSSSSSSSSSYLAEDDLWPNGVRGRRPRRDTVVTTATTSSYTADSIHSVTSKLQLTGVDSHLTLSTLQPQVPESASTTTRPSSFSPGYRPNVTVLPADLAVVGLSSEESDAWATKLIRLLLFTEDVQAAVPSYYRAQKERAARDASEDQEARPNGSLRPRGWSNIRREPVDDEELAEDDESDAESFHSLEENDDVFESSSSSSGSLPPSSSSSSLHSSSSSATPQPFFSFTRTSLNPSSAHATSSSLTADIYLLAVLFPPEERHWIFCGDEFERLERLEEDWEEPLDSEVDQRRDNDGFFRCLHVDLQDFGLDRHGLVSRFSALLHAEGIHHLYSSTFKTANLLVSAKDSERALKVLRGC